MRPQLSPTERIALEAGTVGFEGELFSGRPDWRRLLGREFPELSVEERAFLEGPCETLCRMIEDFEITHHHADLPPELWEFLKRERFFGMIIPREFGGLGFSAQAHALVLQKIASISPTVSSTVAVPNSLGPAELLLHYGTEEQKRHWLPRLACGEEIPCFALTGPQAGSDATSIPDYGVVCRRVVDGREQLGIRLTFDKRYITLAPVATVIGLAFRLYDPERLLGGEEDLGITLALVPRATPGVEIGRRHFPLNIPFQNGPIRGRDVFVPLEAIIGGPRMAGHGWRMLIECLSVGRAISLPSSTAGAMKMAAAAVGAYARIRKQFGLPIGRFEGVQEALARIAGNAYVAAAVSRMTAAVVDLGEKPAVPSAIAKYHVTEMGRQTSADAMDVAGGKGIVLGPRNFLGRGWQVVPITITVEGANILTRSMMIFGQGAIRCHPFVLEEMRALEIADREERLRTFDRLLFGHIGFALSNAARALLLGLGGARLKRWPGERGLRRLVGQLDRMSAALALVADTAMLVLGGRLKQKESLSARLGDVLSELYLAAAVLKRHHDEGSPAADRPLVLYALARGLHRMQEALDGFLRNFRPRPLAWLLRLLVFPLGRRLRPPSDRLAQRVANLLLSPSETRDRLIAGAFLTPAPNNPGGRIHAMLPEVIAAEPVERKLQKALKSGEIRALDPERQLAEAVAKGPAQRGRRQAARARAAAWSRRRSRSTTSTPPISNRHGAGASDSGFARPPPERQNGLRRDPPTGGRPHQSLRSLASLLRPLVRTGPRRGSCGAEDGCALLAPPRRGRAEGTGCLPLKAPAHRGAPRLAGIPLRAAAPVGPTSGAHPRRKAAGSTQPAGSRSPEAEHPEATCEAQGRPLRGPARVPGPVASSAASRPASRRKNRDGPDRHPHLRDAMAPCGRQRQGSARARRLGRGGPHHSSAAADGTDRVGKAEATTPPSRRSAPASVAKPAEDVVEVGLRLVAAEAGFLGLRPHRGPTAVALGEGLEAPAAGLGEALPVLHHDREHLAPALGHRPALPRDLEEIEDQHRAIREAAAAIAFERLGVGIDVVQTAEGLVQRMPGLEQQALHVVPGPVALGIGQGLGRGAGGECARREGQGEHEGMGARLDAHLRPPLRVSCEVASTRCVSSLAAVLYRVNT
ncbi:MAG: acyl-CoA dehydrogenase [Xanthomonadales bacterium]|nr:acyl-CoA dehydrogenase [Xanthomonadales bacterium]